MIKQRFLDFFIHYRDAFGHATAGAFGLGIRIEKLIAPAKSPAAIAMLHMVW